MMLINRFQDSIAKNRCWPIEIFRLSQPAGGKIKKVKRILISKMLRFWSLCLRKIYIIVFLF